MSVAQVQNNAPVVVPLWYEPAFCIRELENVWGDSSTLETGSYVMRYGDGR